MGDMVYVPPGYDDALDVNTTAAVAFVEAHRSKPSVAASAALPPLSRETIRTLLVVDAACDLPRPWLEFNAVAVMPRHVHFRGQELIDTPGADASGAFAQKVSRDFDFNSRHVPLAPAAMRDSMQRYMLAGTEAVVHICTSAKRSKQFVNALSATQSLVLIHNKVRRTLGQQSSLTAWVIDSTNALGGVGVLLAHAVQLRERGMLGANIAVTLNSFRRSVHTLIVPNDLSAAAYAARSVEQQSVSGWKISLANLLNLRPILHLNDDRLTTLGTARGAEPALISVFSKVARLVNGGALLTPFVSVSYSGKLDEIERLPDYAVLRAACNRHQVTLCLSSMSLSGALALGARATSVSFASQQFQG